jgi:hypothetical protein
VLRIEFPIPQETYECWPEKGSAVVDQKRVLPPSREVKVMASPVVRKGNPMEVQFSQQYPCQSSQNECPSTNHGKVRQHHEPNKQTKTG